VAHAEFHVEVLTPEGTVFEGDVVQLSTRTGVGSIGVLAHHMPLLTMLEPTELRLYESESDYKRFAQGEGYMQVVNNRALLLVEEATPPDKLDVAALRERLSEAEQALEQAEEGSEAQRKAARDVRRWSTFLEIAGGSE
jgi:F-type H+-transporting ATPase subunit epsilon